MNYSSSEQLALLASRRHQLHCRVIGTLLTTGVVLGFGGFAADVLMEEGLLGEKKWASSMQIVWSTGMAAFLLAIMPTHATSVQVACLMWLLWATLGAFNAYMQVLPLLPAPPTFWRTREMIIWSLFAISASLIILYLLSVFQWDFDRGRFKVPPRLRLLRLWKSGRAYMLVNVTIAFITLFMNAVLVAPQCILIVASNGSAMANATWDRHGNQQSVQRRRPATSRPSPPPRSMVADLVRVSVSHQSWATTIHAWASPSRR